MQQTLFEQSGVTDSHQGDSLLPDVKLPDRPEFEIDIWGQHHRQFLKQHHRIKYYNMLTKRTLILTLLGKRVSANNSKQMI